MRASAWWCSGIIGLAFMIGAWRQTHPPATQPAQRDPHTATDWMADTLPKIGAKQRSDMTKTLRDGDLTRLPSNTRTMAAEIFTLPPQRRRDHPPSE